jgi:hypothetical protein
MVSRAQRLSRRNADRRTGCIGSEARACAQENGDFAQRIEVAHSPQEQMRLLATLRSLNSS